MTPTLQQWAVESADSRQRLDLYLTRRGLSLTRSRVQKLIESGHIRVNDRAVRPGHRVRAGEQIQVQIPPPVSMEIQPEAIDLEIVHEDGDLLVVNKPAGMVVHPAAGNDSGTLVHALLHHCRDLSGIGGVRRPGVVHRLDKETSGLLVVAKNDTAHLSLSAQFKAHTIHRRYLALVHGLPRPKEGTISLSIGRDQRERKKISPRTRRPREAVTHYQVLEAYPQFSLLAIKPHTGRTHQIRVHLAHLGHPITGDKMYRGRKEKKVEKAMTVHRQMLHAEELGFQHPGTGKFLRFSTPIPADMEWVIAQVSIL